MKYRTEWKERDYKYLKGTTTLMCSFGGDGGWAMIDIPIKPASTLKDRKEAAERFMARSFSLALVMIEKDLRRLCIEKDAS